MKKESTYSTLNNGMKSFWLKYSVGLHQNLNPTIELNPSKRLCCSHLICTLISENQVLQKLSSVSNLRKIWVPAHLSFFPVPHLNFFQVYDMNLPFFQGGHLEKKSGLQDLNFFWGVKETSIFQDLNFQKSRCRLKGC